MWSCKKCSKELLINGFSFSTEFDRIIGGGGEGGREGAYSKGGLIELLRYPCSLMYQNEILQAYYLLPEDHKLFVINI